MADQVTDEIPTIHQAAFSGRSGREVLAFEGAGSYTCDDLEERASRTASFLKDSGVGEGDRVAVMLPNCIEFIDVILATSMLGGIVVPMHVASRGEMLDRALRLSDPTVFVGANSLRAQFQDHTAGTVLIVDDKTESVDWSRIEGLGRRRERLADGDRPDVEPASPVVVYASSGTTGPAKGVTLCHAALMEMTTTSQIVMGYTSDDVAYTSMPLFHANAFVFTFLAALRAGARTVIAERFHVTRFWERLADMGVTKSSLLGSGPSLLLNQPPTPHDWMHGVDLIAAVPRPPDVGSFEERFEVTVTEFYGSTEANLPLGIPLGERKAKSCGRLLPGWQAMIADEQGYAVESGTPGELLIRPGKPHVVSSGYWGEPERTLELWRDLWVHTGDLMRQDEEGWYYFIDRTKDAIRVSGENVASADVEQAVALFPGVSEVAAFGVPSELGEQDIMVAVVSAPTSTVEASALVEFCRERLPYFAVPRYVDVVDELPKTPTAKLRKGVLRERGVTPSTVDCGRSRRESGI